MYVYSIYLGFVWQYFGFGFYCICIISRCLCIKYAVDIFLVCYRILFSIQKRARIPPNSDERTLNSRKLCLILCSCKHVCEVLVALQRKTMRRTNYMSISYYYNSWPVSPVTQVTHVRMCQAACSSRTHTARANAYIHRKHAHTHRTHTPHTHAHAHEHTWKHTRTRIHRTSKQRQRHIHRSTRTHTHAHKPYVETGSDTLAKLRRYVFKHNVNKLSQVTGSVYRNCDKRREETISHPDKQRRVVHFVM
ncbi:unnamed protein product [Arctogadus glacialis]